MNRQGSWPLSVHLTALGMEVCCIYPGLALMREHLGWGLAPFLLILFCYPSVFLLNLTLTGRAQTANRGRILTALGMAFALGAAAFSFLDIPFIEDLRSMQGNLLGVAFQIVLCALLWWLGVSVIPHKTGHRHIHVRFQIAALVLMASVVLGTKMLFPVILFSIFAVAALTLARWDGSAFPSTAVLQPMRPRSLVLGVLSILVPGTILLLFLSPDLARAILRTLTGLGSLLVRWLDQVATPAPAGKPLDIHFLSGCTMRASKEASPFHEIQPLPDGAGIGDDQGLLWFVVAGLMLAAALLFLKITISRVKRRPEPVQGIAFETASIRTSLFKALTALLGNIGRMLGRLFRLLGSLRSALSIRPKPNDRPLSTPRGLYRALLQWTAQHYTARSLSQTPLEYLKIVCGRFPQKERELSLITEVYIQARYGRLPPSREEFEEALMAWTRVQTGA